MTQEQGPRFTSPQTMEGIFMMVEQNDQKHEAAHRRLRDDLRELQGEVTAGLQSVRDTVGNCHTKIDKLAVTPIDATKLVMTPGVVVSIMVIVVAIAGSIWAANYTARSDVRNLSTQVEAIHKAIEAGEKLRDVQNQSRTEQFQALKSSVDAMQRRIELQQYVMNELSKSLMKGR